MVSTQKQVHVFHPTGKTVGNPFRILSRLPSSFSIKKRTKNHLHRCRRGLSTVAAVLMLFLMFTALTTLITAFFQYNLATQEQMQIEHECSQEKIALTQLQIDKNLKIANVTITNAGTIEVKIRALYHEEEGEITFLTDPSTQTDTAIAVGNSITIDTTRLGLMPNPYAMLIAATERGTRSQGINEISLVYGNLPSNLNTSQLSIGPLSLSFTSLEWTTSFDHAGNPIWLGNPNGWIISSKDGNAAWRLNVTDLDTDRRNLTITQFSGFTISSVGGTQATTWYLNVASQTLYWNQTSTIVFLAPKTGGTLSKQTGPNNVFLTFFGNYSSGDTFAQTIPFEAITVTK